MFTYGGMVFRDIGPGVEEVLTVAGRCTLGLRREQRGSRKLSRGIDSEWMRSTVPDRGGVIRGRERAILLSQIATWLNLDTYSGLLATHPVFDFDSTMTNSVSKMIVPKVDHDEEGNAKIDTWVQAPTPTTAEPYKPSLVTWARGMGT